MSPTMESEFAQGLREELVALATGRTRRRRLWFAIGSGAAVALAVPAAALAVGYLRPGVNEIDVSTPVVATHTGASYVDLGPRPDGATHVWMDITCLSGGSFVFDDTASVTCATGETTTYSMELADGATGVTISADASLRWQLSVNYQEVAVEPFAANANGDTFGTPNEVYGEPDLVAAEATNGEIGYVYASDLDNAFGEQPTTPDEAVSYSERVEGQTVVVPVYLSDGETQIGEFVVGG